MSFPSRLVIQRPVEIHQHVRSRFTIAQNLLKPGFGLRQVMQDTKRINHVEASRAQRQMEQVGLHDVRVLQMAGIVKRSIYCWTDVYSDDLARVLRCEKQMPALTAACVKQDLAAKTLRRMRSEVPAEVGLALRAE